MKQQQQKKKEKPRETDAPQGDEKELQTLQESVAALEEGVERRDRAQGVRRRPRSSRVAVGISRIAVQHRPGNYLRGVMLNRGDRRAGCAMDTGAGGGVDEQDEQ